MSTTRKFAMQIGLCRDPGLYSHVLVLCLWMLDLKCVLFPIVSVFTSGFSVCCHSCPHWLS